jgi:hypothetical protein
LLVGKFLEVEATNEVRSSREKKFEVEESAIGVWTDLAKTVLAQK